MSLSTDSDVPREWRKLPWLAVPGSIRRSLLRTHKEPFGCLLGTGQGTERRMARCPIYTRRTCSCSSTDSAVSMNERFEWLIDKPFSHEMNFCRQHGCGSYRVTRMAAEQDQSVRLRVNNSPSFRFAVDVFREVQRNEESKQISVCRLFNTHCSLPCVPRNCPEVSTDSVVQPNSSWKQPLQRFSNLMPD